MNNITRIALLVGLLSIIILSLYSLLPMGNEKNYIDKIETHRAEKDIWLGSDFDSPFLLKNAPFHRLSYFAPNADLMITADFSKRFMFIRSLVN